MCNFSQDFGLNKVKGAFDSGVDSIFGKPSQGGTTEIPGIIGRPEAAKYLRTATGMTGQDLRNQALLDSLIKEPSTTPYTKPLETSILNPNYSPVTEADRNLVNTIMNSRQGSFNALGIGASPSAQTAIAASAAPTLVDLHQRVIDNIMNAEKQAQAGNQQRFANVLASLDEELKKRGIDLDTLLRAAHEGQPQLGTNQTGATPGILSTLTGGQGLTGGSSGASALGQLGVVA